MKKALSMLALVMGVLLFGMSRAYAAVPPTIDGLLAPAEWDNYGYPYFLHVDDAHEIDIPDQYNIKSVTVLQEFGGSTTASTLDDGVYILIECFAPPSLVDEDHGISSQPAKVEMAGDFDGNGTIDIRMIAYNMNDPLNPAVDDKVELCLGSGPCNPGSGILLKGSLGFYGGVGNHERVGVFEFFIPTGLLTPVAPFPSTFIGYITYDNGGASPDDQVFGMLIPEPSTMMMLGSALLGLIGYRKRFSN